MRSAYFQMGGARGQLERERETPLKKRRQNSQKRRKEEVGETWKRVFPFHVQVLGAVNRSPAGRRIPAAQKRRPRKGDVQELSAIEWSLNPRLFQGTKARQRGARYTVDRKCIWRLPGTLAQL